MDRLDKDTYYLNIAEAVSRRGTCLRRNYGAIIVKNDQIIATGYNGSPRGEDNCSDLNHCPREALNIPQGERYEICRAVHAEMNAVISASRNDMIGATLYLYGEDAKTGKVINAAPCSICSKLIKNAGILKVICSKEKI